MRPCVLASSCVLVLTKHEEHYHLNSNIFGALLTCPFLWHVLN